MAETSILPSAGSPRTTSSILPSEGSPRTTSSILAGEVEQFARMADDWWDPAGSSAMLHKLNPVRLDYIRDRINQHWQVDEHSRRPLEGRSALDVGCGAGLLAEPLARLGAIDYHAVPVEEVEGQFDLITSLEVIEHVADPQSFIDALAKRLAPGGLLILSTPNQTSWSRLLTITLAEGFGRIPKGTHDFGKFIAPERMKSLLAGAGLQCLDFEGIAWTPMRGLHRSEDLRLNYLVAARWSDAAV
jgi:2-polyprenyl-6-hydroxyphenyl methylase/3-demethylubiquinone-9 3-methyltransferase